MKNNLLAWLASTGLDEQRAAIYLAALSRGEASAADLARDMHLARTAMYDNLQALEKRGLVKTVRHGKRLTYIPLHPKELLRKMENQKEQLKDLLPDFLSLFAEKAAAPFVQTFNGPLASREIFEDILRVAHGEYVYFSPPAETFKRIDRAYIAKWIGRRVQKGIRSRSLRVPAKEIKDALFAAGEEHLRQIRYLPAYVDLKSTIYIYGNNIGIISTKSEDAAFILYSPDLAFSLKQLFEFLWSISLAKT